MIIIDSDVIIWLLRGNKKIKEDFKRNVGETTESVFLTPIQIAEIYACVRDNERVNTELFIDSFNVLRIDQKTGKLAGEFLNKYGKSHNVTIADALVASSAITNGFKLWTLNKKHYPMINKDNFM